MTQPQQKQAPSPQRATGPRWSLWSGTVILVLALAGGTAYMMGLSRNNTVPAHANAPTATISATRTPVSTFAAAPTATRVPENRHVGAPQTRATPSVTAQATPTPRPTLTPTRVPTTAPTQAAAISPEEQAIRKTVLLSNAVYIRAMEDVSTVGLATVKMGDNLSSTEAVVASLAVNHEHWRIQAGSLRIIWVHLLAPDHAQALLRKDSEVSRLYRDGQLTPLEVDTTPYSDIYDVRQINGHWYVDNIQVVEDTHASADNLMTNTPTPLPTATPESTATPAPGTVQWAVARLLPSVVLVNSPAAQGTGFVVASSASSSFILTNNHVISGSRLADVQVTRSDGSSLTVVAMQTDASDDLAVLQVRQALLPAVQWATHNDEALGETVITIGYADGFLGEPSVTSGILSALERQLSPHGQRFLQHTAPTNHGNSGSPLADLMGRVLGVNSYGYSDAQGLFLAIPSDRAIPVMRGLIAGLGGVPQAVPTVAESQSPDPSSVVQSFYLALTRHDYAAAYALFDQQLKEQVGSQATWAAQFKAETRLDVTSATLVAQDETSATVVVTLDTTWTTGTAARRYAGAWGLLRENGIWRLDKPTLIRQK